MHHARLKGRLRKETAMIVDVYPNAVATISALDSLDSDIGILVSDSSRRVCFLTFSLNNGESAYVYARKSYKKFLMVFIHADRGVTLGDDFGGVL